MTGSNSMSSGYCSLDEESDDFTFFTAKTSFFRRPHGKQGAKVTTGRKQLLFVGEGDRGHRMYAEASPKNEKCYFSNACVCVVRK